MSGKSLGVACWPFKVCWIESERVPGPNPTVEQRIVGCTGKVLLTKVVHDLMKNRHASKCSSKTKWSLTSKSRKRRWIDRHFPQSSARSAVGWKVICQASMEKFVRPMTSRTAKICPEEMPDAVHEEKMPFQTQNQNSPAGSPK